MVLADVMAVVFAVLGLLLALPGLWLLCRGLWPEQVQVAENDCAKALWKPFLVGLLPGGLVFAVVSQSGAMGPIGGILAIGLLSIFVVYASVGIAGLATLVGKRLASPRDIERPWLATLRGGVIVEVSCLIPFVGWFILLPLAFILGSGATTRTFFASRRAKPANPGQGESSTDTGSMQSPEAA